MHQRHPLSATPSGATSVPALRRATAILDHLAQGASPQTLTQITRALRLPKSTAHGLVQAMEELGLLHRTADGAFRIGLHPLQWANGFLAQTDLITHFNEYFATHRELIRFTVTMTVLDGQQVTYIACAQANQPLGVTFRIGMHLPAAFTATGKALLACLSPEQLDQRFADGFPAPLTAHSVATLENLRQELVLTRARGLSMDDGQVREGMICLGTVIRDHTGQTVAGMALSLTRSEATPDIITALGAKLQDAARGLSAQLGYSAPTD
ncbi:MAG TPA: IclR family transcriptional regulator [Paenirhodobacter sp.]